jgi:uncharacterized membrane protein
MNEAAVVNLFLLARVLLVGAILLVLPRIGRKGLMFGVHVGEAFATGETAHALRRGWDRGCVAVMALALLVGLSISAAGWPVTGNLTGTGVLLVAALVLYVLTYRRARAMAPPAAQRTNRATAPLVADADRGRGLAWAVLIGCVAAALASLSHAVAGFASMPEQVPTLRGLLGYETATTPRSLPAFLVLPGMSLVLGTGLALSALLVSGAKRSIRAGSGGRSLEAQAAFRLTMLRVLAAMALLFCGNVTLLSFQVVRVALGQAPKVGSFVWWAIASIVLFGAAALARILVARGQGGARIEEGSEEAPLTGGLADNSRWVLGMFYVDREDPSLVVEKRFGIGYTFNYGRRIAVWCSVAYGLAFLALLALFGVAIAG